MHQVANRSFVGCFPLSLKNAAVAEDRVAVGHPEVVDHPEVGKKQARFN